MSRLNKIASRLCQHGNLSTKEWTATAQNWNRSFTHFEHHACQSCWPRGVRCTKSQSSLLNIYFHLRGFQSPLLLLRSKHPKTLWQGAEETYPICDNPLARPSRCSFASLYTSNRNHRSYVFTEALPGIVFVSAQELSSMEQSLKLTEGLVKYNIS